MIIDKRSRQILTVVPFLVAGLAAGVAYALEPHAGPGPTPAHVEEPLDYMNALMVFMLGSFIGMGVIQRVSRLLHTPLMSLTNAISAIAIVGAIMVAGNPHYPQNIRILGAIALFASMTNIVSGFLITNRMLKMFKTREPAKGEGGKS